MKIGFDAKRAYFNKSGLGNYSRNTINLLSDAYKDDRFLCFTPSMKKAIQFHSSVNIETLEPTGFINTTFKSYWRSFALTKDLKKSGIDIFHGLSNELPKGIEKTRIKSVVTIHDLIFLRYPDLYKSIDCKIYLKKFSYACKVADLIIAVSEQTKRDIVDFLKIDPEKIAVVYQGCSHVYSIPVGDQKKEAVRDKYELPNEYIFYVGTIEERKNLFNVVKAIHKNGITTPLIAVGRSTPYAEKIREYIVANGLEKQIRMLHDVPFEDLPALYQASKLFVYPSIFEGFGIPILEALSSGVPVITSKGSCFSEPGGEYSIYVSPDSVPELADAIMRVLSDEDLQETMIQEGKKHAANFTDEKIAKNMMLQYKKLLGNS